MGFWARSNKRDGWLAVAFGAGAITAVATRRAAGQRPAIVSAVTHPVPAGQGAVVLEKLNKELQAQQYRCLTTLGGGEYQFLSVEAPNVPPAELKTAVGWKMKDMIDFPLAEATVDVLNIPAADGAARSNNVFAIAARNSVVAPRQDLFDNCKMLLSVIDIPEMAQRNISAMLEPEGRGLAMLSFDHDGGLLTVTFRGELYLSRRIDVTLAQLLDAPSEQHRSHDRVTLELQRSLDHFERQFHFVAVSRLMLAPTGEMALLAYLAANLYIAVEALDLSSVLDLSAVPALQQPSQQAQFFLAAGAALRLEEVVS